MILIVVVVMLILVMVVMMVMTMLMMLKMMVMMDYADCNIDMNGDSVDYVNGEDGNFDDGDDPEVAIIGTS